MSKSEPGALPPPRPAGPAPRPAGPAPRPWPRPLAPHPNAQPPSCRCGVLNCEAVLELLLRHLGGTSERVQMVRVPPPPRVGNGSRAWGWTLLTPARSQRALGAIASLGCTDLLAQERVLLLARPRLQELSAGSPGPVTNKATKVGAAQRSGHRTRGQSHPPPPCLDPDQLLLPPSCGDRWRP